MPGAELMLLHGALGDLHQLAPLRLAQVTLGNVRHAPRSRQHPRVSDELLASIAQPVRIGVGHRDMTVSIDESAAAVRSAEERRARGVSAHAASVRESTAAASR